MKIKPIVTPEMFRNVLDEAQKDNHGLLVPNLVALDDNNQIIGAVTQMPVAMIWMHTQRAKPRDAFKLKDMLETQATLNGAKLLCFPCTTQSPYYPLLPKTGFTNYGSYDIFIKGL